MQETDYTRKYQTKIDFLQKENSQLRNENLNLQKLIKLQHEKQEILEDVKSIQCQYSSQSQQQSSYRMGSQQSKPNPNKKQCTCKEVQRTNVMLSHLFNKTMIENRRLTALISAVQNERDTALSKALIHEQIMEGLQLEEIDIIESLNGQIITLKNSILQQSNEISALNKKLYEGNLDKKGQNIIDLEKVTSHQSKGEEKKTSLRVIELNNLLEQCLEQLNSKNLKIKSLEEQKNELIMINSILTAEVQQLKFNRKETVNLTKIIHHQQKLFCDEEMISSNMSNMSFDDEVLPDKVNFKKDDTPQLQKQQSSSPLPKNVKKNSSYIINLTGYGNNNNNNVSNQLLNTEVQLNQNNSQINISQNKNNDQTIFTIPNQTNQKLNTNLNNSFQNASMISNVPKLDLTKALKVQQISVNNQQKQDQIKQQIYSQYKQILDKQKLLLKRKQDKLISDEQLSLTQAQIISQEEDLLKELRVVLEESSNIQEEIKKLRSSLEQSYFRLRQQETQVDTLQRDLTDAVEKNSILIQSNLQYENKWKKIQLSFSAYKDFYLTQQSTSQMNTCSTRNHNYNYNMNAINNNFINYNNQYNANAFQSQSPHVLTNSDKQNNTNNNYNGGSHFNFQLTTAANNNTMMNNNNNTTIIHNNSHQVSMNQINNTTSINPFNPYPNITEIEIQQQNQTQFQNNQQFFQQYEQLGQKIFDEGDVYNSVFVPLSLRKNNEKKLFNANSQSYIGKKNLYSQLNSNTFNINDETHFNNAQTSLAAAPFSSNNFHNSFCNPQQTQIQALNVFGDDSFIQKHSKFCQPQVRNIQEAKTRMINLAQELYFTQGLNKLVPFSSSFESPIQSFRKLQKQYNATSTFGNQQNSPAKSHKKRNNNFKSRSFSPQTKSSSSPLVPLPFRCFLKYKNVQPLRVFQTKTMAMHNQDRQQQFSFLSSKPNTEQFLS